MVWQRLNYVPSLLESECGHPHYMFNRYQTGSVTTTEAKLCLVTIGYQWFDFPRFMDKAPKVINSEISNNKLMFKLQTYGITPII